MENSQRSPINKNDYPLVWGGKFILFSGSCFILSILGYVLGVPEGQTPIIWFPAGLGLALVWSLGWGYLPAVLVGTFLGTMVAGNGLLQAAAIGLGTTASAALGVAILKSPRFDSRLARLQDILLLYLGGAILGTLPGALFSAAAAFSLSPTSAASTFPFFFSRWLTEMLGVMIIAPIIFTWRLPSPLRLHRWWYVEAVMMVLVQSGLILGNLRLMSGDVPGIYLNIFIIFLIMVAAGLRFGTRGASLALGFTSILILINMLLGGGPIYTPFQNDGLMTIKGQIGVIAFSLALLAAALAERDRAREETEQANRDLEKQVELRTEALANANAELQAQIYEREKAQEILQHSEAHYRSIVEDQTEFVMLWKPDTTVTFVNQAFCHFLQRSRDELIGTSFLQGAMESDHGQVLQRIQTLSVENPHISYESRTVLPSGAVRWVRWTDRALFDEEGHVIEYQSVGLEITARKLRERELEVEAHLSTRLRSALSRGDIYPAAFQELIEAIQVQSAVFVEWNDADQSARFGPGLGDWARFYGSYLPVQNSLTSRILADSDPVWDCSSLSPAELEKLAPPEAMLGIACLPLQAQGRPFGAVWIGRWQTFNLEDRNLAILIFDIVAKALDRAALSGETETSLQRLKTLRAIDIAITSSLDIRVTLGIVLDHLIGHLGVDAAAVMLYYPQQKRLEYALARGIQSVTYQMARIDLTNSLAGQVVDRRKLVVAPDYAGRHDPVALSLRMAGERFATYIGTPLIAKGQVKGVLELFHRTNLILDNEWIEFLNSVAVQAAIAIDNSQLFDQLQQSNLQLSVAYEATIEGWARALELRNREIEGHGRWVAEKTIQLARAMRVPENELLDMRRGALLHDIGKMVLPDSVLFKPGPLDPQEWTLMRRHPVDGYEMLISIPYLRMAVDIPYCHHEKWDGTGYPRKLHGRQIPFAARIFAVVDVWDALRNDRPYRKKWPREQTLSYINSQSGKFFDPDVVQTLMSIQASLYEDS